MSRTILFNKPFDVLPQFTDRGSAGSERRTLSNFIDVPGVYPAGRLDRDSEGLMVLTDDGRLQARISNPRHKMAKTYWVQVEGIPDESALQALRDGMTLKDGPTRPARAWRIDPPKGLWPRNPPIRVRKSVPDCWIALEITEGRNRQVRRMVAHVGHPCLRLIRAAIGPWSLDDLPSGSWTDADPLPGGSSDGDDNPTAADRPRKNRTDTGRHGNGTPGRDPDKPRKPRKGSRDGSPSRNAHATDPSKRQPGPHGRNRSHTEETGTGMPDDLSHAHRGKPKHNANKVSGKPAGKSAQNRKKVSQNEKRPSSGPRRTHR